MELCFQLFYCCIRLHPTPPLCVFVVGNIPGLTPSSAFYAIIMSLNRE